MKIKLILADKDECYIDHFLKAVRVNYFDRLEVSAFSNPDSLQTYLDENDYGVVLYSQEFSELSISRGTKIRLIPSKNVKEMDGEPVICKYQKFEMIYKSILNAYAEVSGKGWDEDLSRTPIVTFISAAGGVGKTTVAITYARHLAMAGKNVLYLSLEPFSCVDRYLKGEGEFNLSHIYYAIKRSKGSLALKIESALRRDYSGVHYFSSCNNPMETNEVSKEEWITFLKTLKGMNQFDAILVDMQDSISDKVREVISFSNKVVVVTSENDMAMDKTKQMIDYYKKMDENNKTQIVDSMVALLNKHGRDRPFHEGVLEVPFIGKIADYGSMEGTKLVETMVTQSQGVELLTLVESMKKGIGG